MYMNQVCFISFERYFTSFFRLLLLRWVYLPFLIRMDDVVQEQWEARLVKLELKWWSVSWIQTGSMIISILFILSRVMFIIDDFVPEETIVLKLFHVGIDDFSIYQFLADIEWGPVVSTFEKCRFCTLLSHSQREFSPSSASFSIDHNGFYLWRYSWWDKCSYW